MKKIVSRMIAVLLVCGMILSLAACGNGGANVSVNVGANPLVPGGAGNNFAKEDSNNENALPTSPKGEYNEGIVLVKVKDNFETSLFGELKYTSAEALYDGSKWYLVKLADNSKTEEAVSYLADLDTFEKVDYDYIMGVTGSVEDAEGNPNYDDQVNLGISNIPYGWGYNEEHPGGSPDVVVAIIDTGVDYNHLDLRNNIWVNAAEIPDNGIDDDGNGYIDDIHGWDCVGNDKDPMDDNGHGTHVAGIVAAENNKIGGVGVAYNCKIMVLKAGNSSGYFNNSDIAEAIQYAYMNGASVINMSFGGSQISIAVEEALENAYNTTILVAAAGNDGACNNLGCKTCEKVNVSYPAALPYVIGVMSTDKDGKHISSFSNYDHYPYDSIEYEVYAVGEGVGSTWPGNKYTCLNGTSMAAPTVAGIAALLRSYYSDREVYSTKFIQSQIVNAGSICLDGSHNVADAQGALTKFPKPAVNLYDYFIDDSTSINSKNNGNGVIDAGETIRLHIALHNRGGVANNVNVSIDTYRSEVGDETLTDPYFTFVNNTIALSDIGTYSVRESGDKYFEIIVSPDCPNDYLIDFNIRFTCENGMDEKDNTAYSGDGVARFNVSRGFYLPATITEDTVYKADKLYIVGQDVVIPEGVTVTFEAGCEIQFYDDREYYNSPTITNYGRLLLHGNSNNTVKVYASERYSNYGCLVTSYGTAEFEYIEATNLALAQIGNVKAKISNSQLVCTAGCRSIIDGDYTGSMIFDATRKTEYTNCYIRNLHYYIDPDSVVKGCYIYFDSGYAHDIYVGSYFGNNIVCVDKYTEYSRPAFIINNGSNAKISNNAFLVIGNDKRSMMSFKFLGDTQISGNYFDDIYRINASEVFSGYYDSTGTPTVNVYSSLANASILWPYVVSVEMFNKDGELITTIGKEEIKVRVTFNRPMDKNAGTFLTFGTIEPYADYRIDGEYISDTVWEGTYTLKAQIENGQNFLKVNNAWAAEDRTKTVFGEFHLHEFTIDTTAAMSMNLQAVALDNGIQLTFAQDDYDTLLGYNIYRSTEKDGNYVKLNPAIVLPEENTFLDENAEPGKTYWYTYTVVLSDFTESNPAGKVQATAKDTMAPSLYHTPVNQGYDNNNLVISCTASDNMQIVSVTLYYRTVGSDTWKSLTMSKVNDKYSSTIFGSELTLDGVEYYIVASDGTNTVSRGTADAPYTVVVKDASSISRIGDVDGNGTVTTKDALMLMQCLNGDLILTDDAFKRADLNGDGILSSVEALRILQYVNGKVNTLEM